MVNSARAATIAMPVAVSPARGRTPTISHSVSRGRVTHASAVRLKTTKVAHWLAHWLGFARPRSR